ncbi:MAG: hypothetical protein KBT88_15805 [Gammaproteobacteria bacterium]|nr:hypothetical protein [Gammaproteobacteria bacterium]
MMKTTKLHRSPSRQKGAATLLVSIVLLIGVTLITIFAARVGVMDQRIAGNEYRHKEAFAAANAALDQGAAYLAENNDLYGTTHPSWVACTGGLAGQFPCLVGSDTYEFAYDDNLITPNTIDPLSTTVGLANVASDSYLVFTTSASIGNQITVLGTGESADGTGESIAQLSYAKHIAAGLDKLPPVLAPIVNLSGSFLIVADPQLNLKDGADCALGRSAFEDPKSATDISIWTTTSDGAATGSWSTCLSGDFQNAAGEACVDVYDDTNTHTEWANCTCADELSEAGGTGDDNIKYDIRIPGRNSSTPFPPSPLEHIFGTSDLNVIEADASVSLADNCPGLGSIDLSVNPFVFVDGDCSVGDIGSQSAPLFMVVAGDLTITAGADVWGIVIGTGTVTFNGTPIVHGSVVSDDPTRLTNGNYTQIFDWCVGSTLIEAVNEPKLVKVKYSWRNFTP